MITTIQIRDNVKRQLDSIKIQKKESYEEVILRLLSEFESKRRLNESLLKEECLTLYSINKATQKEWEPADKGWD